MTPDSQSSFDAMLREAAELCAPALDSRPPELGELLQNKYRIEEMLGAGGMGAVFRATNVENRKQVAIKWPLSRSHQAALRFTREAQVAARIDHPNVVNVFDLGKHRGAPYLVMELLRGQSLGEQLRQGLLEPIRMVEIMIPVLHGIAAAHAAGVIHRDLKPDNVFLCVGTDGAALGPKLLDFGIAKLRTDRAPSHNLTGEGTRLGTPGYMSLEQLLDSANVDERTDIYAAGVTMYEALTGSRPFRGESYDLLAAAVQKPLPMSALVPGVPEALERIVMRAIEKEAKNRYPDARSLIDALEAWLDSTRARAPALRNAQEQLRSPERAGSGEPRAAERLKRPLALASLLVSCLAALWLPGLEGTREATREGSVLNLPLPVPPKRAPKSRQEPEQREPPSGPASGPTAPDLLQPGAAPRPLLRKTGRRPPENEPPSESVVSPAGKLKLADT